MHQPIIPHTPLLVVDHSFLIIISDDEHLDEMEDGDDEGSPVHHSHILIIIDHSCVMQDVHQGPQGA
jgi:hypothetical protein